MAHYAWIITADQIDEGAAVGTMGPATITPWQEEALTAGKGHTFYLLDDDGERYYKGRAVWNPRFEGHEDQVFGPLDDFGAPNAGCTLIRWHGRPEWDN